MPRFRNRQERKPGDLEGLCWVVAPVIPSLPGSTEERAPWALIPRHLGDPGFLFQLSLPPPGSWILEASNSF